MGIQQPRTLFARTGSTLMIAMLVFLLFSVAVVFHYILIPVSKRAADDLATLMVLAAQTWVELPPETRPDFERELLEETGFAARATRCWSRCRARGTLAGFGSGSRSAGMSARARSRSRSSGPKRALSVVTKDAVKRSRRMRSCRSTT